jgi:hypothetical protein
MPPADRATEITELTANFFRPIARRVGVERKLLVWLIRSISSFAAPSFVSRIAGRGSEYSL